MRIGEPIANRTTSSAASTPSPSASATPPVQDTAETTDLNKGDVLEGKVIANNRDGSSTVRTSEGKEIDVKIVGSDDQLAVGKNVRLQMEEVTQQVKTVKLIPSGVTTGGGIDSAVDNIIKTFGEVPNDLQRRVVKAMVQFDVPLTKENYKAIQNEGKYAQKLGDLLSSHPELGEAVDLTAEVKNILVKLLSSVSAQTTQATVSSQSSQTVQASQVTQSLQPEGSSGVNTAETTDQETLLPDGKPSLKGPLMAGDSKSQTELSNVAGDVSKKNAGVQNQTNLPQDMDLGLSKASSPTDLSQTSGRKVEIPSSAQLSNTLNLESLESEAGTVRMDNSGKVTIEKTPETSGKTQVFEADGKAVKSEILQSLKEHSADKTAFFKKMSLDATLSNIVTFNRLMINKQSMIGSFQNILSNMNDLGITQDGDVRQLLVKLSNLEHQDLEGHIQILNQLSDKVTEMKASHGNQLDPMTDQLSQLKSDFDFIKNINENLVYYQMPMHYQEGTGQLEVAYKKRKKDPSEGHKIFISLDTKNIGQIQAMVELKGKNVKINFRVPNEDIKKRFEEQFEGLKEALSTAIEVEENAAKFQIELGFILRESPLSAMDLFREEVPHLSAFDLSI